MFGKSGCKCHRCVARRRLNFTLAVALFALIPIGYLALPDHWQSPGVSVSSAPRESPSEPAESAPEIIAQPRESRQALAVAATPIAPAVNSTPVPPVVAATPLNRVGSATSIAPVANQTPIASLAAATPVASVTPQTKQAVVATASPAASSGDSAADFSTVGPRLAAADYASRPLVGISTHPEKGALANNALSRNPTTPQSVPLVGPTRDIVPPANISNDTPADHPNSELRGYITVESKAAPPRTSGETNHLARPGQPRPDLNQNPMAPRQNVAKVPDSPVEGRGQADKVLPSGDLQRFALDFVQTDMSRNVASEHRFYAESVHFFNEGDLSWSGVAAATRRYHQGNRNKQFQVAGRPVVKGPVNGGFYVVEQPVSWTQNNGSSFSHGRSILRLRVLATGKAGWKITSIEEVGR